MGKWIVQNNTHTLLLAYVSTLGKQFDNNYQKLSYMHKDFHCWILDGSRKQEPT